MSPIMPNCNGQHGYHKNQSWQDNNFDRRQVPEERRFSQSSYNNNENNPDFLYVLDGYSTKQALTQMSLNSIQEYDGRNKDAMIPWLDHIKMVVEKYGIDPLEVGISKLKGLALGNINVIHKEGNLTWYSFRQRLNRALFKCTICIGCYVCILSPITR